MKYLYKFIALELWFILEYLWYYDKNYSTMEKLWYYRKNGGTIPKTMELWFTMEKTMVLWKKNIVFSVRESTHDFFSLVYGFKK